MTSFVEAGLIEMTIPDKPQSSKQKYRLSDKDSHFCQVVTKLVNERSKSQYSLRSFNWVVRVLQKNAKGYFND
ncbi:MAG: hypothetical protein V1897_03625 [Pseudomonadota bacterium]